MQLLFGLSTVLSLALVALSANHNVHLNRHHDSLAKRAAGHVDLHKRYSNSKWTYYDAETGNAGACGRYISNNDFAVALNTPQYGSGYPGPECFKTITLSYGGKTAQAVILDQCPGCPYGGLDLTPALFAYFAPHSVGILYGVWTYGGAAEPPKPAPPKPTPTTTWKPTPTWKPEPTTTWKPITTWKPKPTTTPSTTWTPPTSSRTTHRSSSSAVSSSLADSASRARSSASGSGSARPAASSVATGSLVGNTTISTAGALANVNRLLLAYGNLAIQAAASQ